MNITVNGESHTVTARSLADVLAELGYGDKLVATALNGDFVPVTRRSQTLLAETDRLEVIAPVQGG